MDLREIIKPVLMEWPMTDNVDQLTFEINRLVSQLDDLALGYEAKWGIGQLEAWASEYDPALAEKFQRQLDKLADALAAKDLVATRLLVDGFTRAYGALEANAVKNGKAAEEPVIFFCKCGSTIYKIVRTLADTKRTKAGENEVVMSCQELINLYAKDAAKIYAERNKDKMVIDATDFQGFDWKRGDDLPDF